MRSRGDILAVFLVPAVDGSFLSIGHDCFEGEDFWNFKSDDRMAKSPCTMPRLTHNDDGGVRMCMSSYSRVNNLDVSCDTGTQNGSDAVDEAVLQAVNANSSEEARARHNGVFRHICRLLLLQYGV